MIIVILFLLSQLTGNAFTLMLEDNSTTEQFTAPEQFTAAAQFTAAEQFTAAVYEYEVKLSNICTTSIQCSRQDALETVEENLAHYRIAAKNAKEFGAQMILFPEDGLGGVAVSRNNLLMFAEPLPVNNTNPCQQFQSGTIEKTEYYTSIELSCLARNLDMYISANFPTTGLLDSCKACNTEFCLYNTQVVFDRTGSIAAVYRKYNLWTGEDYTYNIDQQPQLNYFDTDFGRFGLATCADLLWESPTVTLVNEMDIDTLLLPLYWGDFFPHQLSHSCESAWARGLQVNIMAANIKSVYEWSSGSGLYTPDGTKNYNHNSTVSSNTLLVGNLDVHPRKKETYWNKFAIDNNDTFSTLPEKEFNEIVYGDDFKFVPILPGNNSLKVCTDDGNFCCLADYQVEELDEPFSIGVFAGSHTKDTIIRESWYMEMCTVMKCDPKNSRETCSQDLLFDYDFLTRSTTVFKYLNLSATFSNDTAVYPQVLFDEVTLQPDFVKVSEDGILGISGYEIPALVSMSLFGRRYSLDAPYPEQFCPST